MNKKVTAAALIIGLSTIGFGLAYAQTTSAVDDNVAVEQQLEQAPLKAQFFTALYEQGIDRVITTFTTQQIEEVYNAMTDEEWMDYSNFLTTEDWLKIDDYMYGI